MRVGRYVVCAVLAVGCRNVESTDPDPDPDGVDAAPSEPDAGPEVACDPFVPRAEAPELLVMPDGFERRMIDEIESAESRVWLLMYQFDSDPVVDAIIAARARGVDVRVMVDGEQGVNAGAKGALAAGGVTVRDAPARFDHNHAKLLLVDDRAIVMSANFNYWSFERERNYGVVDRDREDVDDFEAIYEADWTGAPSVNLTCTRLVVSPVNARQRILSLVNSATTQLDLEVMYISDEQIRNAVKQRAGAGVPTRVILANPEWIDSNAATASELRLAGAQVKYLYAAQVHSKLIIADGVVFVGSENLSWTSLEQNREVGVFVTEAAPAQAASAQFAADWAAGVAP